MKFGKVFNSFRAWALPFLLILSAIIWVFCFWDLLSLHRDLSGDAPAYYGHVKYFFVNISHGIYPFWDLSRDNGVLNEFFLRRIGEFNPLLWVIVVLNHLGFEFIAAHRIFLGLYFLLGVFGFYLIARLMLKDRFSAFAACLLLLFSSIGTKVFESFLVYEITPYMWFFYFFCAQLIAPRKVHAWGLTFCTMIIAITYIPFYLLTGVLTFLSIGALVYWRDLPGLLNRQWRFMMNHRGCVLLCAFALTCSLLPGLLWQHEASTGETVPYGRYVATENTAPNSTAQNTATVTISRVNEGGIVAPLMWEQTLCSFALLKPGDFYIPLFALIILACGLWTAINRRLVFLAGWGFLIFLIGAADASFVHGALYQHVFFFKYFRNVQFFLWFFILPIIILFVAEILRQLLSLRLTKGWQKSIAVVYVAAAHGAVLALLWEYDHANASTYIALTLSLLFFTGLALGKFNTRQPIAAIFLMLIIIIPSLDLYHQLIRNYPLRTWTEDSYCEWPRLTIPDKIIQPGTLTGDFPDEAENSYFGMSSFYGLSAHIKPNILHAFLHQRFFLIDRVEVMDDRALDYARLQDVFEYRQNVVFIPPAQMTLAEFSNNPGASPQAQAVLNNDPHVHLESFNTNEVVLHVDLPSSKFLLDTNNYHKQWRVSIDGKPAVLFKADMAFRGVWVPQGEHRVVFHYGSAWRYALSWFLLILFAGVFINVLIFIRREGLHGLGE